MTAPIYSNNLTKLALAKKVATKQGIEDMQILSIIEDALDFLSLAIAEGRRVDFRGFGNFELITIKERIGRNPKKPTIEIVIPATKKVKFQAGKRMKARIERNKI